MYTTNQSVWEKSECWQGPH